MGIGVKIVSMLASLALHAAVLATAVLLIGETGTGPAESNSTLHVRVERIEPADESPRDNPAPEIFEQTPAQLKTTPPKPRKMVEQVRPEVKLLKTKLAPTKALAQQQSKNTLAKSQSTSSKPTSNKKGADVTEKKPMQLAKLGNYGRLSRDYQSRLQRLVERHKYYPLQARRSGIQGKATISFTVRKSGKIDNIVISRSSGKSILDRAAIRTIKRLGTAPPFPDTIKRTKWRFEIPIYFNLK